MYETMLRMSEKEDMLYKAYGSREQRIENPPTQREGGKTTIEASVASENRSVGIFQVQK